MLSSLLRLLLEIHLLKRYNNYICNNFVYSFVNNLQGVDYMYLLQRRTGLCTTNITTSYWRQNSRISKLLFFVGFESRSAEVGRGWDSIWAISRRPEACRSSESHQNADVLILYLVELLAGPSYGNSIDLGLDKDQRLQIRT